MNKDNEGQKYERNNDKMNKQNEEGKQEVKTCGSGCDCGSSGSFSRCRWFMAITIIVVAGVLVARAVMTNKDFKVACKAKDSCSALPAAEQLSVTEAETESAVAEELEKIASFGDLNNVAISHDAVLVFIPKVGSSETLSDAEAAMQKAQTTLKSSNIKLGLYTLAENSPDYPMISAQANPPAIIVAVKGRGMQTVPATDVTESKILQAFMSASSAGGCGAGGCGPVDCN